MSRVAIETMGGHNIITITGEVTSNTNINVRETVKNVVGDTQLIGHAPGIVYRFQ
jgi:S-adenosylmethionine synthetase